jgi:hypothetical protein
MAVPNTLAYYDTATITAIKSYIVQAIVLKNFLRPLFNMYPNKLERLSAF